MNPYMRQRIGTVNDVNGNPRRLWLGYSMSGEVLAVKDEGYSGEPWLKAIDLPAVEVAPSEYRRLKRVFARVLVES